MTPINNTIARQMQASLRVLRAAKNGNTPRANSPLPHMHTPLRPRRSDTPAQMGIISASIAAANTTACCTIRSTFTPGVDKCVCA